MPTVPSLFMATYTSTHFSRNKQKTIVPSRSVLKRRQHVTGSFISFKEIDKKRDRKRNVVPAQCGIMNAAGLIFTFIVYGCLYSIPNNNSWAAMDTMTRQGVGTGGKGP